MELTGTNGPTTCPQQKAAEHCTRPLYGSRDTPHDQPKCAGRAGHLHRVTAVIARGKRPVPFRTRKLSPSAPMVLHGRLCGRVGRRRTTIHRKEPPHPGRLFSASTGQRSSSPTPVTDHPPSGRSLARPERGRAAPTGGAPLHLPSARTSPASVVAVNDARSSWGSTVPGPRCRRCAPRRVHDK